MPLERTGYNMHVKRLTIRNVPTSLIMGMDLQAKLDNTSRERMIVELLSKTYGAQEWLMKAVEQDLIKRQLAGEDE